LDKYRIYALKYAGPFIRREAFLLWLGDFERTQEICYFFWLLRSPAGDVLVDAGVSPAAAAERELSGYISPDQALARFGVEAAGIKHVILTHLHWDHMDGASLFPAATFYVQQKEYDFWQHDPALENPTLATLASRPGLDFLAGLEGTERLVLLEGEQEVLPGLTCFPAPGHTPGLQAVAVETEAGTAVLGSDCGHVFQNYRESRPSCLICDLPAWIESFKRVKERASSDELLFPGHDSLMLTGYPREGDSVTRLV
jgi:glyoxylase-like metal-dependent hydrolase (beta-lactamase superfamily II)